MSTSVSSDQADGGKKPAGQAARPGRFNSLGAQLVLSFTIVLLVVVTLEGAARAAVLFMYGRQDKGFHHVFSYETFLVARSNERFLLAHAPKAGRFRILILGGSTADQLEGVSQEYYARLFGKLTSKAIEVINFAQAGSISSQELVMLARYGIRLEPDIVIAVDGVNDIVTTTKGLPPSTPYTDAYVQLAMNRPFLNALVAIGRGSQLVNVFRKLSERRNEKALQAEPQAISLAVAEYIANHSTMAAIANGIGTRFVTVLQPYIHLRQTNTANEKALSAMTNYVYRKGFMTDALSGLRAELSRQERRQNAAFIDSTPACDDSTEDCFVDEVHLTGHGKQMLLNLIANGFGQTPPRPSGAAQR